MSFSSTFQNDVAKLIFQATGIANIADNASSSPLTNLFASLHTANPGTTPAQTTSEAAYGSYARVALARSSAAWTVTGNSVSPVADINFPTATSGSETETYAGVGTLTSGTGKLLVSGALTPSIVVTTGTPPVITTSSAITLN